MSMNRRSFFKRVAGVVAGVVALPVVAKSKPSEVFGVFDKAGYDNLSSAYTYDSSVKELNLRMVGAKDNYEECWEEVVKLFMPPDVRWLRFEVEKKE